MKKTIYSLAVVLLLIAGSAFTSCSTATQKDENNTVAQDDNKEVVVVATPEEWQAFKTDADAKIKNNEIRIEELTVQMNKPGELFDEMYKKRIQTLEQQNKDLRNRIDAYDRTQTDWEKFKREFNHDMDELGNALKDITVNNKN